MCGLATILAVFSQVFVCFCSSLAPQAWKQVFLEGKHIVRKRVFLVFSTLSDLISDLVVDAVVLIERLAGVFVVVCDLAWEQAVSCSA